MDYSYRYMRQEVSYIEAEALLLSDDFDIDESLSRMDFDRNSFGAADIGVERLLEIRLAMFSLFDADSQVKLDRAISASEFDRVITKHILDIFKDLSPYEAAQKPVWAYLTLRLLPDLAKTRFPHHALERYTGGERNVFRRLWQRAFILGGDLAAELQEDEHIKIFERGLSLGSNRIIAKCLAEKAIAMRAESKDSGETSRSSKIMAEATKNLRRRLFVLNIQAMPEKGIREIIEAEMDRARNVLAN